MLRSNHNKHQNSEFVSIENLVPQDHMLRKIKKYIDFSFIDAKVRPLYCEDNGRPAIIRLCSLVDLPGLLPWDSFRAAAGTRNPDECRLPLVSGSGTD
jgi:hypothetical protein